MSEDQFTRLFKYMEGQFAAVRREIHTVDKKIDHVYEIVDVMHAKLEANDIEHAAMIRRQDRHEGWIHELAHQTKSRLSAG